MTDLRARIVDVLKAAGGDTEALADAVMAVVNASSMQAFHNPRGRCRWCNVITSEVLARGRELKPHRMTCRFYGGPVEHRPIGGHQMFTHWATDCSCGKSYDAERGGCPNATEIWREPASTTEWPA